MTHRLPSVSSLIRFTPPGFATWGFLSRAKRGTNNKTSYGGQARRKHSLQGCLPGRSRHFTEGRPGRVGKLRAPTSRGDRYTRCAPRWRLTLVRRCKTRSGPPYDSPPSLHSRGGHGAHRPTQWEQRSRLWRSSPCYGVCAASLSGAARPIGSFSDSARPLRGQRGCTGGGLQFFHAAG